MKPLALHFQDVKQSLFNHVNEIIEKIVSKSVDTSCNVPPQKTSDSYFSIDTLTH